MSTNKRLKAARMGLIAVAASSALLLGACGGGGNSGGGNGGGAGGGQQQSGTAQGGGNGGGFFGGGGGGGNCAAVSNVLNNTQSYVGKPITVTGTVGQAVSPQAFTITANGGGGGGGGNGGGGTQTLLVVRRGNTPVTPGSPIEVAGTFQPTFNTNQAQSFTGGNLNQPQLTPFNGQPYVEAVFAGPVSANLPTGGQSGGNQGGNNGGAGQPGGGILNGPAPNNGNGGGGGGGILGIGGGGDCASVSNVLNTAQSYAGKPVTVTGTVAQAISPQVFTVTANGGGGGGNGGGQTLLVVQRENTRVTPGSPVEVIGTLQPTFNTNQAQSFTGGNLNQPQLAPFNGQPYVEAVLVGASSANLGGDQGGGGGNSGNNNGGNNSGNQGSQPSSTNPPPPPSGANPPSGNRPPSGVNAGSGGEAASSGMPLPLAAGLAGGGALLVLTSGGVLVAVRRREE